MKKVRWVLARLILLIDKVDVRIGIWGKLTKWSGEKVDPQLPETMLPPEDRSP
tara:strand:+ start:6431 stop:6589 length:159 start_codon:yes stop_codon:yes gene_type:complete